MSFNQKHLCWTLSAEGHVSGFSGRAFDWSDTGRVDSMTSLRNDQRTLLALDDPTRHLVRLAAVLAIGDELTIRAQFADAFPVVPALWIEELILQCYLFCG